MNTHEAAAFFVSTVLQIREYLEEHSDSASISPRTANEELNHCIADLIKVAEVGSSCARLSFFEDASDHGYRTAYYTYEAAMALFQFALIEGCRSQGTKLSGDMITVLSACATCANSHNFICQLRLPYMYASRRIFFENIFKLGFFLAKNAQRFSALPHDSYLL